MTSSFFDEMYLKRIAALSVTSAYAATMDESVAYGG